MGDEHEYCGEGRRVNCGQMAEDIRWWAEEFKWELGSGKQPLKVRAGDRLPATLFKLVFREFRMEVLPSKGENRLSLAPGRSKRPLLQSRGSLSFFILLMGTWSHLAMLLALLTLTRCARQGS